MGEMAEMMYMYMQFKETEEEFKMSMEYMCFMVNATYEAYRRNGTEVFKKVTDESLEQMGKQSEQMTDRERMDWAVDMLNNDMQMYSEIFLKFATWACTSGDKYAHAYEKMEKMNQGHGECDRH